MFEPVKVRPHLPQEEMNMSPTEIRDRLLKDEEFMAGLRRSVRQYEHSGRKATLWTEVARDLAITETSGTNELR